MAKLSQQIEDFWEWFENNQPLLEAVIESDGHPKTDDIVESLDQHILGMGKIKWEIGNPETGQFTFTLSPNNDREILKITKSIIAGAATINEWSFHHSAQATGQLQLQVYDHNMDIQDIDASKWRAVLKPRNNGRYELELEVPNIEYLDEDTQMIATDLILTALLSEENKINSIMGLKIVFSFNEEQESTAFSISDLLGRLI